MLDQSPLRADDLPLQKFFYRLVDPRVSCGSCSVAPFSPLYDSFESPLAVRLLSGDDVSNAPHWAPMKRGPRDGFGAEVYEKTNMPAAALKALLFPSFLQELN